MSSALRSLAIALALVILAVLAFPGMGAPSGGTTRMRWCSGFGGRSYETRGSIEFTDDDHDVKAISPGGYVLIQEGSWLGIKRSYRIQADSSGSLSRTYRVGG